MAAVVSPAGCDNKANFSGAPTSPPAGATANIAKTKPVFATPNIATTPSIDATPAKPVLSSPVPALTAFAPIHIVADFGLPVTGFTLDGIVVGNGKASALAGTGNHYEFDVTPISDGVVTVTVSAGAAVDSHGVTCLASEPLLRTYDPNPPSVTLTSSAPMLLNLSSGSEIPVVVTFSKPVTGFTAEKITINGGTIGDFTGNGAVYTFNANAMAGMLPTTVTVSVAASTATDTAGNGNLASVPLTRVYNSAKPGLVLSSSSPVSSNMTTITVTATFSEPVTGFTASSLQTSNATVGNFAGSGDIYTFTLSPGAEGPYTVDVPANAAISAVGNSNTAAAQFIRTYAFNGLSASAPVLTSQSGNFVWVSMSKDTVTRILLDASKGYPTTTWSGMPTSGHRTFVSPIGLLVGVGGLVANSASIYRANDDVPTVGQVQKIVDLAQYSPSSGTRVCVTYFKAGEQEYIGAGFSGTDGHRKFYTAPVNNQKPERIDTTQGKVIDVGIGTWGYSCYTDQTRNYFWSKANSVSGGISGINMATGAPLTLADAPNGGRKFASSYALSTTTNYAIAFDLSAASQSYSMSGDGAGNLLSISHSGNIYSSAYDPKSESVLFTDYSTARLGVLPSKCFTSNMDCSSNMLIYDLSTIGYIRPLSSLNDGRIIGLSRGSGSVPSSVFLISFTNPLDRSSLSFTKIKDLPGDAYMYTDFTGATLFADTIATTFDLTTIGGFRAGYAVKMPTLTWTAASGNAEVWSGLVMSARCFMKGTDDATKPIFAQITGIPDAGTPFNLSAPSCTGLYNQVEVKVEPAKGTVIFSKTASVNFQAKQ